MSTILSEQLATPEVVKHPFKISPIDDILRLELQPLKMLIGELVYPEEQTILFGGTGLGKTALAMQMAHAISTGQDMDLGDITFRNQCDPIKVLYYDFELSPRQIQNRYRKPFENKNLFYSQVKRGEYMADKPTEVFEQLKSGAEQVEAKCIIIDNISAISGDIEKGENAKLFMKPLWRLVREEGYTIIILAHTPKLERFKPLSIDNIKGSAVIGQLTDNAIAMGLVNTDREKEIYIKQVKVRNSEEMYGGGNCIHTFTTIKDSFLVHKAIGFATETELLTIATGDLGNTDNRMFFIFASLYYGSLRKAETVLKEREIEGSSKGNMSRHIKLYKDSDMKNYKQLEAMNDDELKGMMEFHNPTDNLLPLKEGQKMKEEPKKKLGTSTGGGYKDLPF